MRTNRSLRGWISIALACGALHGITAQAQTADTAPRGGSESPTAGNSLQRIDYAELAGGRTVIRLTFSAELKERPPIVSTHHPAPNITMDFADTSSAMSKEMTEVGQRVLHSIQVLRAGNRLRVVLKLTRPVAHEVELAGRELLLTLHRPIPVSTLGNR
jgi:hypothetical protein